MEPQRECFRAYASFVPPINPPLLGRVLVGQPLDTIKTRMQALDQRSAFQVGRIVYAQEGFRGLYRGGLPLVLGGALIRSAQFGVYENALALQRTFSGPNWGNENRSSCPFLACYLVLLPSRIFLAG
jgi:hypothetical protein